MEKIRNKIEKLKDEFKKRGKNEEKINLNNVELRDYQKDGIKW
jgi:hypothetical protein